MRSTLPQNKKERNFKQETLQNQGLTLNRVIGIFSFSIKSFVTHYFSNGRKASPSNKNPISRSN